jgi:hypothetical protein
VCRSHFGNAPQVQNAAKRRLARERIEGDLGEWLRSVEMDAADRDPLEILGAELVRQHAITEKLRELVGRLMPGPTAEGKAGTEAAAGIYGPNHLGDGAPHVLVEMLKDWSALTARTAKLAADAGLAVRRVELDEAEGALLASVIAAVFAEILRRGLAPDLSDPQVSAIVATELARAAESIEVAAVELSPGS